MNKPIAIKNQNKPVTRLNGCRIPINSQSYRYRLYRTLAYILIMISLDAISPRSLLAYEPIEPELVYIEAGDFIYGSTQQEQQDYLTTEADAKKQYLPAFWIGKYEVSNWEYFFFIQDGGYEQPHYWSQTGWEYKQQFNWQFPRRWEDRDYNDIGQENYPVCAISWYEAEAYCNWLAQKTGKPFRLPTQEEWEKAARGVEGRIFPWGNQWQDEHCNWLADTDNDRVPNADGDGYIRTAPVNAFVNGVSPYGCYNMSGNVIEWVANIIPDRPDFRVFRGGSFMSGEPRLLRCAWQGGTWAHIAHIYWGIIGFRIAMDEIQ